MESTSKHALHLGFSQHSLRMSDQDTETIGKDLLSITVTDRKLCDLELILNGGFYPLSGFLNYEDYQSVLLKKRLANGTLWPIPINFDIDKTQADHIECGEEVALRDAEGILLAILKVKDKWEIDKRQEALCVFGTDDLSHPGVFYLFNQVKDIYLGGEVQKIALPHYYDFQHLRLTPNQLKQFFKEKGWNRIVAFQTRNPMHRAHQELTFCAIDATKANLLIHPVVGMTKPGDIEYFVRVRCYEHVLKNYPEHKAKLSLLPLAMRMAGPLEALWHAIIRKNYGCTHFIIGRDHAGPGKNSQGKNFYEPYAAQEFVAQFQKEIGIEILPFSEMVFSQKKSQYFFVNQFPKEDTPCFISGTELRNRLQNGLDVPNWFSFPKVIEELRKVYPRKDKQGFTVFFTGLPSSGKSTLANHLLFKLREMTPRKITLLDGDVIRMHLSQGLGFSQQDREINISRVGFVSKEVTKHGGIALVSLVAPYQKARTLVREMILEVGGFIEVHVATPLMICEARDRKGHYKKARAGQIKYFTGVSDVYEEPLYPEIRLDTTNILPMEAIEILIKHIQSLGFI